MGSVSNIQLTHEEFLKLTSFENNKLPIRKIVQSKKFPELDKYCLPFYIGKKTETLIKEILDRYYLYTRINQILEILPKDLE